MTSPETDHGATETVVLKSRGGERVRVDQRDLEFVKDIDQFVFEAQKALQEPSQPSRRNRRGRRGKNRPQPAP